MMMALAETLKSVQFVTDGAGHKTAVLVDIRAWEALMAWIEDATDTRLAVRALRKLAAAGGRPGEAGWVDWETASEEWLEEESR